MTKEVNTLWCSNIKLYDPILSISYYGIETIEYVDTNSKRSTQFKKGIKTVYFFLKTLINSSVIRKIKPLKRGLFEIVVFISTMAFNRKFTNPNFEKLNIALDNIIWKKAAVIINTTNLKSIKSDLNISLNETKYAIESSTLKVASQFETLKRGHNKLQISNEVYW